jgi:hypothetical protein
VGIVTGNGSLVQDSSISTAVNNPSNMTLIITAPLTTTGYTNIFTAGGTLTIGLCNPGASGQCTAIQGSFRSPSVQTRLFPRSPARLNSPK